MTRSKLWRAIMFVLMVLAVSGLAVVAQGGQPPGGGPGTPRNRPVTDFGRACPGQAEARLPHRPSAARSHWHRGLHAKQRIGGDVQ